jgi:hypothetical protein
VTGQFEQYLLRYLEQVLPAARRRRPRPVRLPVGLEALPPADIEEVLADPRALQDPDSDDRGPRDAPRRLTVFALWLQARPDSIPAELASRAARFQFYLWSLDARKSGVLPTRVAWPDEDVTDLSPEFVLACARAAREAWLECLSGWEDDPWLAARYAARDGGIEADLRWLTSTWPAGVGSGWPRPVSYLDLGSPLATNDSRRADHRRVAADIAEQHWLPRGRLLDAVAALYPHRRARVLVPLLFPLPALAVAGLFLAGLLDAARWSAAGLLAALALACTGLGRGPDALALLRLPAAVGAGLAVLLSLTSRWWVAPRGWTVGVALLAGSACYLVLEARLHGSTHRVWPRGLALAGIGALHAFVLSVAVLGFVAPVVGEHGECLDGWWRLDPWQARPLSPQCATVLGQTHAAAAAGVLTLMTGWSLAIGLAAQILWDDRPVTAPLGRIRRVRGGRP